MGGPKHMDMIFTPRIEYLGCELGSYRVEGDKVIGEIVARFRMPDPKRCAILTGIVQVPNETETPLIK
jgi:hypothetical protein